MGRWPRNSRKQRLTTLKDKAMQLAILCGIQVCMVSYEADGRVETWPENHHAVREIITRYKQHKSYRQIRHRPHHQLVEVEEEKEVAADIVNGNNNIIDVEQASSSLTFPSSTSVASRGGTIEVRVNTNIRTFMLFGRRIEVVVNEDNDQESIQAQQHQFDGLRLSIGGNGTCATCLKPPPLNLNAPP